MSSNTKKGKQPEASSSSSSQPQSSPQPSQQAADDKKEAPMKKSKVPSVPIVNNPKFDFEAYVATYTGYNKIKRLVFIALRSPDLRVRAFRAALVELKKTLNTEMYAEIANLATEMVGSELGEEYLLQEAWLKKQNRTYTDKLAKLEADLNQNLRDTIRSRIRESYMALGNHAMDRGDFQGALKHFLESKIHTSNDQENLQSFQAIIHASMMTETMTYVKNHAERALALHQAISAKPSLLGQVHSSVGVFELKKTNYRAAADSFLAVPIELGETFTDVILPRDVALYATICGLVTYPRELVRSRLLHNPKFARFLEYDPELLTLIKNFHECNFAPVFHILATRENNLLFDMYLADHVKFLFRKLRQKSIIQYFKPFVSVKISSMAQAFGLDPQTMENELVTLIAEDQISARIDSQNKVLYTKNADQRLQTYEKALEAGTAYVRDARSALLRMALLKNDFYVQDTREMLSQVRDMAGMRGNDMSMDEFEFAGTS